MNNPLMKDFKMSQITVKVCGKCKTEKTLDSFYKSNKLSFGVTSTCKDCYKKYQQENKQKISERHKEYYAKNVDLLSEKAKARYAKNPAKTKNKVAEYRKKNPQKVADCARANRNANKEKIAKEKKEYQIKNKAKIAEYQKKWVAEKNKNDAMFAMKERMKCLIRNSIMNGGYTKKSKTTEILGCNYETFKNHIESQFKDGMSWENKNEWHFDHIIPLASAKDESELIRLNHYKNIQPLWAVDNLSKGSKMPKQSIVNTIQTKIAKEKGVKLTQGSIFNEC
jgi:hypothetical protein